MSWLEDTAFLATVLTLAYPFGSYLTRICERRRTLLDPVLRPVESALYRLFGVNADQEMSAAIYAGCFVLFGAGCALLLFLALMLQRSLPGGPADAYLTTSMTADLAANTAVSFATTTTWQAYGAEHTLRYLSQLGLVAQNFLAAAGGLAVGFAFIRGFARQSSPTIGNFWVDLVRALLWVLLPLGLMGSLLLISQGVPLNMSPYTLAHTLEGRTQVIAQGPVAALEFIKNLGTNGGGFFNANGAHPFANPSPLTNFIGMLAICVLPAGLMITLGQLTQRVRASWLLLSVMAVLFIGGLAVCDRAERAPPPQLADLHLVGGNMEGKEVRFGIGESALTTIVTANTSTGSFNAMQDSYRPLGVLPPLVFLLLGGVVFGGLGTGVYSIVMMALLAAFLGALMIGRSPEYLGKKVTIGETRWIALYVLATPLVVLLLTAVAVLTPAGRAAVGSNPGARSFTEILFTYASCMANNGLSLGGLEADTPFYNVTTVLAMLAGRYGLAIVAIVAAGRFAAQRRVVTSSGTLPVDTPTFGLLLLGTILLAGALSFLAALAMGPIAELFPP
ncbi:MAG TPA: potassium-transporting ATPase subunit KdpA [Steroidobacteraceae bacterium]|nr:potassium-transporting ATPase subunit KdpA [Steroidobacteraceae bacterium]